MMQWFTMEMWAVGNHPDYPASPEARLEARRRSEEYANRYESFRNALPSQLIEADSRLHDAELVSVHAGSDGRELRLTVRPCEHKTERWVFTGVAHHEWINHQIRLGGPPGFGHLGYSEIAPRKDGFSMAILFSSGLELVVRATGFRIEDVTEPFKYTE